MTIKDNFSDKTSNDEEGNETQRTMHNHQDDSSSTSSSSSYFLDGKTSKTEFRRSLELAGKNNDTSSRAHAQSQSCPCCGQEFSSTWALGGHIPIHKKPKLDTCYICKQSFQSIKSLCGHMRIHPGREWKSIQPPQAADETALEPEPESSQLKQQEPAKDLVNHISNWLVTGKRGRKAIIKENLGINNGVPEKKRKLQISLARSKNKFPPKELKTEKEEEIPEKDLPERRENNEQQQLNIGKVGKSGITGGLVANAFSTFALRGMLNDRVHVSELLGMDYAPTDNKKKREATSGSMVDKTLRQHLLNKYNYVHVSELASDIFAPIDNKNKREASPGSLMVDKSHKCKNCGKTHQTSQSLSNHNCYLQKETADAPSSSIKLQEEAKETDFQGESTREDGTVSDHKDSLSPVANQAGSKKMLDFDLNLPYKE
ncbi:hypothetical protein DITRI_Ditri18aG0023400 [Diplodiscus trichospermus]